MQAWQSFPSRHSPSKVDPLSHFQHSRVSREVACGGCNKRIHGFDNVATMHLSPFAKSKHLSRDLTGMWSDLATSCLRSGAENSAAAAAALSTPQAELCATNAECVTVSELGSVEGLAKWLEERIPAEKTCISSWGDDPRTKRVANLWVELVDGEISLEDSKPPKRTVHVASVKVINESGLFLIESHQEMDGGRTRPRNRPLSEKMRPGENVEDACRRGIFEELGPEMGGRDRVEMVLETYQREEEERDSFSYPGLLTRYVLHTMVASVRGLPSSNFCTQENEGQRSNGVPSNEVAANGILSAKYSENGQNCCALGVKKHHWKWVTDVELHEIMKRK